MEQQQRNKILIVGTDGMSTRLLVSAVQQDWDLLGLVLEEPISGMSRAKNRAQKIGWWKTLGQVLFIKCALPFLGGQKRKLELFSQIKFPEHQVVPTQIKSVNDGSLPTIISELNPDYILLSGCRILSKNTIDKIQVPILNIHAGITPKYRGVHGGYWALRNNDAGMFGVTLHQVDTGIDTGKVIAQKVLQPSPKDNFKTYPFVQLLGGIDLLNGTQKELWSGKIPIAEPLSQDSQLFYHPTIGTYLNGRIFKGIR